MAKCDYTKFSKLTQYIGYLLQEQKNQFQALSTQDQLVAKGSLQGLLDAGDVASCSVETTMVIHRVSHLQCWDPQRGPEHSGGPLI